MSTKILIVDDERDICEILAFNLANEGYEVECVYSAEEALKTLDNTYNLMILDVMMGGMSGYKLAETLRRQDNHIPIVFSTAKGSENDMLTGFSVGADDYIIKPFSLKEVIARVKAVLKRTKSAEEIQDAENFQLIFENVVIDWEKKEVFIDNKKIILTKTEFEILYLLAQKPEKIFSREDIISKVWKDTYISDRSVDVHITRLRKKLGDYAYLISNRSGYGYKFNS